MPDPRYVLRCVNLERSDYNAVAAYAEFKGLGRRGFSAALRMIIRDWAVHIAPLEDGERRLRPVDLPAFIDEG